ncbi:MAG: gamma-glutamyl-gamma-aminobutyrate hydrolase family protein [Defluviitaleaceae bacterium]|nr:gamma-glutamyl-gamma-aminobutyrate hydrolase family protein [Defluviitaleaceae bacterium]
MKRVLVSQRVDMVTDYNEVRDSLDQNWVPFLWETGAVTFPVPNFSKALPEILNAISPQGILLTGGYSSDEYHGISVERDKIDNFLLDYAVNHKIPLIGVCRGMQSILLYFGGNLKKVDAHVRVKHKINGNINRFVKSFHNYAANTVPPCLDVFARTDDGVVEGVKHSSLPIMGIMWHPEREEEIVNDDVKIFNKLWGINK